MHCLHHLLATLEVLQFLANGIQDQVIVSMRHNLCQNMLCPIFSDEFVRPRRVINVGPNVGVMRAVWNVGNHMLMKFSINLPLRCDILQYDLPRVLQKDAFVPSNIISDWRPSPATSRDIGASTRCRDNELAWFLWVIRIWDGYGKKRLNVGQVSELAGAYLLTLGGWANSEIVAATGAGGIIVADKELKKVWVLIVKYGGSDDCPTAVPTK
jgi:hypothetical protein